MGSLCVFVNLFFFCGGALGSNDSMFKVTIAHSRNDSGFYLFFFFFNGFIEI